MILLDVTVQQGEGDNEGETYLLLQFTKGTLAFECPIGLSDEDTIKAFRQFLDISEKVLQKEIVVH